MIGVPIAVNRVAWDHLPEDPNDNKDDHHWWHTSFDRVWKARLIAFASWFAVTLLCYIPIIVWKVIVRIYHHQSMTSAHRFAGQEEREQDVA